MKTQLFKKLLLGMFWFTSFFQSVHSQNLFNAVYPIGEGPNIGYKTSMISSIEDILFEANPIVRLPIYNNIENRLISKNPRNEYKPYKSGSTVYINFRPQLRMYTDNSLPVKTPSYKISILGFQYLRRLPECKFAKNHFLAFSYESGHYSNGQAGCAFSKDFEDGTQSCDSICALVKPDSNLSNMLNRESGNFSTNFTEIIVNYRLITAIDDYNRPISTWSFKTGINRYHNKMLYLLDRGGYTTSDIKIYGRNRFIGGVEYILNSERIATFLTKLKVNRVSCSLNTEYIDTPHPFVEPWRNEITGTLYFKNNLGFFISGAFGHDNYNYRFVDSGTQIFAGITLDVFPPIAIK